MRHFVASEISTTVDEVECNLGGIVFRRSASTTYSVRVIAE